MADAAPNGQGGTPEQPPTGQNVPGGAGAPGGAAIPWLEGADPALVGYVQNKGWEKPQQMLESYQNLEKLLGADRAGHTVVLPKPDAPKADLDAFYNRLGRPADPAGYKIPIPAENGDPEFAKLVSSWFHELGLTKDQGEKLAAKFNEHAAGITKSMQTELANKNVAQQEALKTAWGAAFNQNTEVAAAAARGLGIDKAMLDALDRTIGFDKTMQMFHTIGSKIAEPGFVAGKQVPGFGAALTPAQALARIAELRADSAWAARLMSKDAAAQAEWTQLHKYAYPEGDS